MAVLIIRFEMLSGPGVVLLDRVLTRDEISADLANLISELLHKRE